MLVYTEAEESRIRPCPDCGAVLEDEAGAPARDAEQAALYRCTRCGAGWERDHGGWLFPYAVA